jgi:hypothetical protein
VPKSELSLSIVDKYRDDIIGIAITAMYIAGE